MAKKQTKPMHVSKPHSPKYYTASFVLSIICFVFCFPIAIGGLFFDLGIGLFFLFFECLFAFCAWSSWTQKRKIQTSLSSKETFSSPSEDIQDSCEEEIGGSDFSHNVKQTNPTAHNAYIFNAEYISHCRKKFISFDLETTGLSPFLDRIVEISAITFENFSEVSSFSTLVNPGRHIPEASTQIHGISDSDVENSPSEFDAINSFCEYIGKSALDGDVVLVAHNAPFDIKFLLYAFSRCGIEADISFQDTLYMCRKADLPIFNNKLPTVAEYFKIEQQNHHHADDDAKVCGEIFIKLLSQISSNNHEKLENLTDLEKQLCYWFKQTLAESGCSTFLLTYQCSSSYFYVNCLYNAFKLKPKAKIPYLLAESDWSIPEGLTTAPAVKSEGEGKIRVFFRSPSDLDPLKPLIVERYSKLYEQAASFISSNERNAKSAASDISSQISID